MDGTKRTGLGRGFGALIPQAPIPKPFERSLPLDQVGPNPWQPRIDFDDEKLREMAESIREHGVVEPLVVRQRDGSFELVAGERRLRAARLAGLQAVPVVVRDMDDREVLEVTLIENLQREDLSALEEAAAYVRLMEEFGATQEDVARRVGKSRPAVANTIRLLQLPEAVRDEMRSGRLSAGHARALLALESPIEQTALARDVDSARSLGSPARGAHSMAQAAASDEANGKGSSCRRRREATDAQPRHPSASSRPRTTWTHRHRVLLARRARAVARALAPAVTAPGQPRGGMVMGTASRETPIRRRRWACSAATTRTRRSRPRTR